MSSHTIERSCTIPAANALPRVVLWFEKNGYEVVARSANEMSLFHKAGSALAGHLHEHNHRLSIRSDGKRITFDFAAGFAGGGIVIDSEKSALEKRVDSAMQGLLGIPAASGPK